MTTNVEKLNAITELAQNMDDDELMDDITYFEDGAYDIAAERCGYREQGLSWEAWQEAKAAVVVEQLKERYGV